MHIAWGLERGLGVSLHGKRLHQINYAQYTSLHDLGGASSRWSVGYYERTIERNRVTKVSYESYADLLLHHRHTSSDILHLWLGTGTSSEGNLDRLRNSNYRTVSTLHLGTDHLKLESASLADQTTSEEAKSKALHDAKVLTIVLGQSSINELELLDLDDQNKQPKQENECWLLNRTVYI